MYEAVKKTVQALLQGGMPLVEKLEITTKDPMSVQRGFLKKLLEDNKDTEYGKKYNFADIHSIEEYRKAVPPFRL